MGYSRSRRLCANQATLIPRYARFTQTPTCSWSVSQWITQTASHASPLKYQHLTKWLPEIKQLGPDVPIILVGLKSDLRVGSKPTDCVTAKQVHLTNEAESLVNGQKVAKYIECSALDNVMVAEAMEQAFRVSMASEMGKKKCSVM
jgi:Ras family